MTAAPLPPNEQERLRSLEAHEILDTPREDAFDDVVKLASEICGTPIALMSLVDANRQWFKSAVGLDISETPRSIAFCAHALVEPNVLTVPDAENDPRFADNPLVTAEPNLRFYAGAPVKARDGSVLGTLCVLDRVARSLSPFQERALTTLRNQVEAQLELRRALREVERRALELREKHEALLRLREQRMALLSFIVHDLKTPIAVVNLAAEYLADSPGLSDDERDAIADIHRSATQMHAMVGDLLATGRAERGALTPNLVDTTIGAFLDEVRDIVQRRVADANQRLVVAPAAPTAPLRVDVDLLRRVFENLVDNCLKYGRAENGTVTLAGERSDDGAIVFRVSDEGPGIPAAEREHVFDRDARLARDAATHTRESHGIGLTFCRAAVNAHGGTICAEDNLPRGATFKIRLPPRG